MHSGKKYSGKKKNGKKQSGFTLIEVMTVLVVISILVGIAVPLVIHSVDRARESALRENLQQMRKALDDYYSDKGRYPQNLQQLVDKKYLRVIPVDPVAEDKKAEWDLVIIQQEDGSRGIRDVKSFSDQESNDGTRFSTW